jgi:hypothetical protein
MVIGGSRFFVRACEGSHSRPAWREESIGRLDSLEPSNSGPDGLVQSGSAIVAAWIPAFAGMTALQMTPLPRSERSVQLSVVPAKTGLGKTRGQSAVSRRRENREKEKKSGSSVSPAASPQPLAPRTPHLIFSQLPHTGFDIPPTAHGSWARTVPPRSAHEVAGVVWCRQRPEMLRTWQNGSN